MNKSVIAILFTALFTFMLITPTAISLLDIGSDISIVIDFNEEEEKEGKESSKEKEVKIFQIFNCSITSIYTSTSSNLEFYSNSYTSNFLELLSPPPEQHIS